MGPSALEPPADLGGSEMLYRGGGQKMASTQKQFTRLRKTAQKCYEQYIKSVFDSFWAPYILLRSNFDSKC